MDYRQNPHLKIIQQCAAAVAEGREPVVVQTRKDEKEPWCTHANGHDGMPPLDWEYRAKQLIRIKPRTVTVAGVELPEPLRVAPKYNEVVWLFNPYYQAGDEGCARWLWTSSKVDKRYLESGLLHSTREAAEKWREFLLSMTRSKE